ncbi:DUF3710 domain-containing protein [Nocardioides insulae]|uniref:DUF3710 domain-containing protein n=1 Tax=Nocardioides insulae TaxID=394734 RepID=UPI0004213607|nr:DUF3710 domain-containing protein [Nocardioides insulae]
MKFRRKAAAATASEPETDAAQDAQVVAGPYDSEAVPELLAGIERVDLGSLLIAPSPGRELRLQVDEKVGTVQAVLLTGKDGALELRAFAAPRNGDLWSEVRPQLAQDVQRRGGKTGEREGRYGVELLCQLGMKLPDGQDGVQPSRIIGVNGDRWMLRATLLGRPAVEIEKAGDWEDLISDVVVRRGTEAMPVGEALGLTMPPQARPVDRPAVPRITGQAGQAGEQPPAPREPGTDGPAG